ncbi:4-carboxymuconolactone decarboxylase /3-oxoadipate enol-lactonase [Agromyces ramosus]|uniref:4-carboxymuconolactone decarboxylase /3-oxoadipate enol-lactonase n=1 Tax=Agromyces ramosus TaxID=33879 RepID=A0A4Q7M9Q5_9MICO|nr:alpha/beta fold hydrolase [Agromyces ramosus]RZS64401.1 4-carboxymuconolactone decarboxylase /3-oxoadipate enol-lactonase [Agromyces ramosus]
MTVPRLTGSVTAAAPTADATELLVLLPSLGTTTELWDRVVAALRPTLPAVRILRVDLPGHGASPVARDPLTIPELAEGVLRVVDEVGGGRFHVAGDSLGGVIALELAVAASDRIASLTMLASGARIGTAEGWAERAASVRASGTASLVGGSAQRWFAPGYLEREPDGPGGRALRLLVDVDDESYARCCEALGGFDRTVEATGLAVPALFVAGEHDGVTTTEAMRALAAEVPGARFVELAGSAHLPPLDRPDEVAALIAERVASTDAATGASEGDPAAPADAATRGMAVRRAVLGDAHVDAAVAAATPETAPFQDFITRYAWGEIWSRPDLSRRERSIATLASLVTGGHEAEIRMHVRAARRNGLERAEITEVILHTALYAGLPAANTALAIAREVFTEETHAEETDG